MTLNLTKIELYNFRCYKHFVFSPDLNGITAILGQNGSGKSTIVDAFAWALYGTRPSKVTNKMLIRDGTDVKTEEVKAIVEITINKIDYRIVRRIVSDSGATDCTVYGKSITGEYNILAGPAVSSAETYIKQIMGMDEKGFLTSVLIQQKQVDAIVSSSPRERAAVIEKLTGISSITAAIDLSKAEAKAYQKAANVITIQDSKSIATEANSILTKGKELRRTIDSQILELKKQNDKLKELKIDLENNTENYNQALELKNNEQLIKQNIKILNDEARRISEYLINFKKNHNSTMIIVDPAPLKNKYNSELSEYLNMKNELEEHQNKLNSLKSDYNNNKNLLENKDVLTKKQVEINASISTISDKINEININLSALTANKKQSKKALSTISSGNELICPICKRPIDNPEDLEKELKKELKTASDTEKIKKKELSDNKKLLEQSNNELIDVKNKLDAINKYEQYPELISNEENGISTMSIDLISKKARVNTINKEYDKAMKNFINREDLENKKKRFDSINSQLEDLNNKLDSISKQLINIHSLNKNELNTQKHDYEKQTKIYNDNLILYNSNKSNLKYLKTRYIDLKAQYINAVKAQKKYDELTSQMKLSAVSSSVMSTFKVDRIKFAVPTIEMYASTILSQFTDSKFTQLKMDGKFNISVITSTGKERQLAELSGGELSAVAIALRLSISMLLSGADKNIIILDEVLVSMDEVRARKIMETISSTTNSQIIFIAHNADIDSVADLVIQVDKK